MRPSSHYTERARARLERVRQHQSSTLAAGPSGAGGSSNNNTSASTPFPAQQRQQYKSQRASPYTTIPTNSQRHQIQVGKASLRALQGVLPHYPYSEFTPETWWIVDRQHRPRLRRGATPLVMRTMRAYGWSETYARRVLAGYKQFLQLKAAAQDWDGKQLEPSKEINRLWQQHILDVVNYLYDCILLCGRVFAHLPDADDDIFERSQRRRNTKEALEKVFTDVDEEVWREVILVPANGDEGDIDDMGELNLEEHRQPASDGQRGANKQPEEREDRREKKSQGFGPKKSGRPVRPKMMSRRERRARSPRQEPPLLEKAEHIVDSPWKSTSKLETPAPQSSDRIEEQRCISPPKLAPSPRLNAPAQEPRYNSSPRPGWNSPQQHAEKYHTPSPMGTPINLPTSPSPSRALVGHHQQHHQQPPRPATPVMDMDTLCIPGIQPASAFRATRGDGGRETRHEIPTPREYAMGRLGYEIDTDWGVQSFELIEDELDQRETGFDPIHSRRQEYRRETEGFQKGGLSPSYRPGNQHYTMSAEVQKEPKSPTNRLHKRFVSTNVPEDRRPITIHIRDQVGVQTPSRARRSTKMGKVFATYALGKGVKPALLHFFLNGKLIDSSDTPESLDLRDSDKIDCVIGHPNI